MKSQKRFVGEPLVRIVPPRGKTELILTVKMETRHPVGDHLVVSFRLCNHCGVM